MATCPRHAPRDPRRRGRAFWPRWCLAAAAVVGGCLAVAHAQEPTAPDDKEYVLKAVYLYALGCNTHWPSSAFAHPDDPFVIGVLGPDHFGAVLREIARKKTLQGRKIEIRHFASLADFRRPCQILFVSGDLDPDQQQTALRELPSRGLLLVGESPGFLEDGGAVTFYREDDRVRFTVNADAAKRADLEMGTQLLKLTEPADQRHAAYGGVPSRKRPRLS